MKITSLILVLVLMLVCCSCGQSEEPGQNPFWETKPTVRLESPVEDFSYKMVDGEVTITGYKGTDLEIYIPRTINERPVRYIGEEAFQGYDMKKIDIPDEVKKICKLAFQDCVCLEEVVLGNGLEEIEYSAFEGCKKLQKIAFPDSLLKIGRYAFVDCSSLKNLVLPDSLQVLEGYTFSGCTSLEKVTLPQQLQEIESYAFENCEKLKELAIPNKTKVLTHEYHDYYSLYRFWLPTGNYTAVKDRVSEAYSSNTTLIMSADSVAYAQIKEAENAFGVKLETMGVKYIVR